MAETYQELQKLSADELIECHNCQTKGTDFLDDYYLRVLNWRIQERQTKWITGMTGVILFATLVNLTVFLYDVFA